jgi:ATP-dependent phosphoenolpyruvate carboxykinase
MSGHKDVWKTGRSPRDKRVVREPSTQDDIWWAKTGSGSPNYEMDDRWALLACMVAQSHFAAHALPAGTGEDSTWDAF